MILFHNLDVRQCDVVPLPTARNTGISIEQQVTRVCQVVYWSLHTISSIHSSITLDAAVKLVLDLVVWRLDFASALLLELLDCLICRRQKLHNAAARMVVCAGRCDHSTPILKRLY